MSQKISGAILGAVGPGGNKLGCRFAGESEVLGAGAMSVESWGTVEAKDRGNKWHWLMNADGETRSRGTGNWRESSEGGTRNH